MQATLAAAAVDVDAAASAAAAEADLWRRILEKRRRDCDRLPDAALQRLLELAAARNDTPETARQQHRMTAAERMEYWMRRHLTISSTEDHPDANPAQRRASFRTLQALLRALDEECGKIKRISGSSDLDDDEERRRRNAQPQEQQRAPPPAARAPSNNQQRAPQQQQQRQHLLSPQNRHPPQQEPPANRAPGATGARAPAVPHRATTNGSSSSFSSSGAGGARSQEQHRSAFLPPPPAPAQRDPAGVAGGAGTGGVTHATTTAIATAGATNDNAVAAAAHPAAATQRQQPSTGASSTTTTVTTSTVQQSHSATAMVSNDGSTTDALQSNSTGQPQSQRQLQDGASATSSGGAAAAAAAAQQQSKTFTADDGHQPSPVVDLARRPPIRPPGREERRGLPPPPPSGENSSHGAAAKQASIAPAPIALNRNVPRGKTMEALTTALSTNPAPIALNRSVSRGKTMEALTTALSQRQKQSVAAANGDNNDQASRDNNRDVSQNDNDNHEEEASLGSQLASIDSQNSKDSGNTTAETVMTTGSGGASLAEENTTVPPSELSRSGKKIWHQVAKKLGRDVVKSQHYIFEGEKRGFWKCALCTDAKEIHQNSLQGHCAGRKHQANWRQHLEKAKRNKNGEAAATAAAPAANMAGTVGETEAAPTFATLPNRDVNTRPDAGIALDPNFSLEKFMAQRQAAGVSVPKDDHGRPMCVHFHKKGFCSSDCSRRYDHRNSGVHSAGEAARMVEYLGDRAADVRVEKNDRDDGIVLDPNFPVAEFAKQKWDAGVRIPLDDRGRPMCLRFHKSGYCRNLCQCNYDHRHHSAGERARLIEFLGNAANRCGGVSNQQSRQESQPASSSSDRPTQRADPGGGPRAVSNQPAWMTRQQQDGPAQHETDTRTGASAQNQAGAGPPSLSNKPARMTQHQDEITKNTRSSDQSNQNSSATCQSNEQSSEQPNASHSDSRQPSALTNGRWGPALNGTNTAARHLSRQNSSDRQLGGRWEPPNEQQTVPESRPPASGTNGLEGRWEPPEHLHQRQQQTQQHSVGGSKPSSNVGGLTSNDNDRVAKATNGNAPKIVEIVAQADRKLVDAKNRNIKFPTFACTLRERERARVVFKASPIESGHARMFGLRLKEWEPFWTTVVDVREGVTSKVVNTSPWTHLINRAASEEFSFHPGSPMATTLVDWGKKQAVKNGDKVLLLRMLPTKTNTHSNYRADCHLWPKGTYLTIGGKPVRLDQRKQQQHDENEWKGMCRELFVSPRIVDPTKPTKIELCCYDSEPFFYSLSVCEYVDAEHVFNSMLDTKNKRAIRRIPPAEAKENAVEFAGHQKVLTIDSDAEEDDHDVARFIFSLTCPISKQLMQFPVRGKTCKHWQCFDLRTYIESNTFVSGGRWRCASCEDFVSLQNLEHCGLTASLLEEFKDRASADRDRVEFSANGSYRLLDERKSRYNGKRPAPDDSSLGKQQPDSKRSKPNPENEKVIDIDDHDVIVID